jgi:hypothetical protein
MSKLKKELNEKLEVALRNMKWLTPESKMKVN